MRGEYIQLDDFTKVRREDCLWCARCGDLLPPGADYYDMDGKVLCEDCFDHIASGWKRVVGE